MDDVNQSGSTPGRVLSETGGAPPSVTSIEVKGIDHITQGERWGRPAGLFWLWAGAVWNVEYVVYGTLLVVVFGLTIATLSPWETPSSSRASAMPRARRSSCR